MSFPQGFEQAKGVISAGLRTRKRCHFRRALNTQKVSFPQGFEHAKNVISAGLSKGKTWSALISVHSEEVFLRAWSHDEWRGKNANSGDWSVSDFFSANYR